MQKDMLLSMKMDLAGRNKRKEYRHLAHLVITLSFRNTVRQYRMILERYISLVPERFMVFVRRWIQEIEDYKENTLKRIQEILATVPKDILADNKKLPFG